MLDATSSRLSDAKRAFENELGKTAERLRDELLRHKTHQLADYRMRKEELVSSQRLERATLHASQKQQREDENQQRQARFRKGLGGIWDRLRGHHRKTSQRNEVEAAETAKGHQRERETMVDRHLIERRRLRIHQLTVSKDYVRERTRLERSFEDVRRGLER